MGCKPSPYVTKARPTDWIPSKKPRGSPTTRLRAAARECSRGGKKEKTGGPGGPEDGAATLLNELEELNVRHGDRHWFTCITVTEPPQHELIQRNPFAALNTCLYAIRVAGSRPLVTGVRLCGCQLEAIFSRVVCMVYGHKGSDVQTVVDALYDVSPRAFPPPRRKLINFHLTRRFRLGMEYLLPLSTHPKGMPGVFVQDLWPERPTSCIYTDRVTPPPRGHPTLSRRVCGCIEVGTSRKGGRSQGVEDILRQ